MFSKCLLFLFIFGFIDAQSDYGWRTAGSCRFPKLEHGKVRVRPRSKIVKFICNFRYELVGNRYATCRNEQWDEPPPVCVKPGCPILPTITNGVQMYAHHRAWMVAFCLPGHKLIGSSVVYCDGVKWNGTAPMCVDSTAAVKYSCDFEEDDLCGWTQDELHDFDWRRINKKTPSNYLLTGPSYDHTYGYGGSGHYMYIESTSRLENDTARLLSPIYSQSAASGGCFSFFYHMFGKDTGGLRVYQKPDSLQLLTLLHLNDTAKEPYLLFEQWGNLGDAWFSAVVDLKEQNDSFQIVIEGIRGRSFTSDIAIDDVAILHGENCTNVRLFASTPPPSIPESCTGRCDLSGEREIIRRGCSCAISCVAEGSCCFDFIEVCLFSANSSKVDDDNTTPAASTTIEPPQTQKLVASTDSTSTTTTTPKTTPKTTTTISTTTSTTTSTTSTTTTTTRKPTTVTTKTTKRTPAVKTLPTKTTIPIKPTTKVSTSTTTKRVVNITTKTTPSTTTAAPTTAKMTTVKPVQIKTTIKYTYPDMIDDKKMVPPKTEERKGGSGALKTALTTIVVLLACLCGAVIATSCARSPRGQLMLARLRGSARRDPEVRYLSADVDD